jgi:hypothetical protein
MRYDRADFILDVERAESQTGSEHFRSAREKWRKWIDSNTEGDAFVFRERRHKMQTEFQQLNPAEWETIDDLIPDLQFRAISPTGPSFTCDGSAILRFLASSAYPDVTICMKNTATKETSKEADICQFSVDGRIETVARICFPSNEKYEVTALLGALPGETQYEARELSYIEYRWRFDVAGAPAAKRHLCQLITGRSFMPLKSLDKFRIEPSASVVTITGTVYTFTCTFHGTELEVIGREPLGDDEQTFFARRKTLPDSGGCRREECTLQFPNEGVWRVMCWVDHNQVCTQTIIAGSPRTLSPIGQRRVINKVIIEFATTSSDNARARTSPPKNAGESVHGSGPRPRPNETK